MALKSLTTCSEIFHGLDEGPVLLSQVFPQRRCARFQLHRGPRLVDRGGSFSMRRRLGGPGADDPLAARSRARDHPRFKALLDKMS